MRAAAVGTASRRRKRRLDAVQSRSPSAGISRAARLRVQQNSWRRRRRRSLPPSKGSAMPLPWELRYPLCQTRTGQLVSHSTMYGARQLWARRRKRRLDAVQSRSPSAGVSRAARTASGAAARRRYRRRNRPLDAVTLPGLTPFKAARQLALPGPPYGGSHRGRRAHKAAARAHGGRFT